jgi:hypothetical protein
VTNAREPGMSGTTVACVAPVCDRMYGAVRAGDSDSVTAGPLLSMATSLEAVTVVPVVSVADTAKM